VVSFNKLNRFQQRFDLFAASIPVHAALEADNSKLLHPLYGNACFESLFLSVGDGECGHVGWAKAAAVGFGDQTAIVSQIRRELAMQGSVRQDNDLAANSLSHTEPVQPAQYWCNVFASRGTGECRRATAFCWNMASDATIKRVTKVWGLDTNTLFE
jgi:hypothetical protein